RGFTNSAQFCGVLDLSRPGSAVEDSARRTVAPMASATRRADIARQFARSRFSPGLFRRKRESVAPQFHAQPDIRYFGIAGFELRVADRARFLAKYPSLLHGVQFTSSDRLL